MAHEMPARAARYENFIGGSWIAPVDGRYYMDRSPIDGSDIAEFPRSNAKDIDLAVAAAWKAAPAWGAMSPQARSNILLKVADRIEAASQELMVIECWGNGKPLRECMFVDLPNTVDQIRYFAAALRADSGESSDIDAQTINLEVHEPFDMALT